MPAPATGRFRTAPPASRARPALSPLHRHGTAWLLSLLVLLTVGFGAVGSASAQDDPPGRVGRLARADGAVWWFDEAAGRWQPAVANWPLTGGDRLATGPSSAAEVRIGSTTLRLGEASEVELQRVDDERLVVVLRSGRLALRLRSREVAAGTEIVTAEAALRPQRAGLYRVDRVDDTTWAAAWRGRLEVAGGPPGFAVEGDRRVEIWREARPGEAPSLRLRDGTTVDDAFAAAVLREDADDERAAAQRFASPEMTGIEELDRDGRWDTHPEYGAIWLPLTVAPDWAPYRFGRWAWVRPWGWTWIDDARWGFATSHYGRWVPWRGRWGWAPGDATVWPVFAPALVAWVGGPALSVSIGLPAVGWLPLAPWERYEPWYRHTPVYVERVNRGRWKGHDRGGPPPGVWGHQRVPGALTVVPRDVLWQQRPVRGAVVDARIAPGQPLTRLPPGPWPGVGRDGENRRDGPRFVAPGRDGSGRDGSWREGVGRDGSGRDGPGRDGPERGAPGRDGLGHDGRGRDGSRHEGPIDRSAGRDGAPGAGAGSAPRPVWAAPRPVVPPSAMPGAVAPPSGDPAGAAGPGDARSIDRDRDRERHRGRDRGDEAARDGRGQDATRGGRGDAGRRGPDAVAPPTPPLALPPANRAAPPAIAVPPVGAVPPGAAMRPLPMAPSPPVLSPRPAAIEPRGAGEPHRGNNRDGGDGADAPGVDRRSGGGRSRDRER